MTPILARLRLPTRCLNIHKNVVELNSNEHQCPAMPAYRANESLDGVVDPFLAVLFTLDMENCVTENHQKLCRSSSYQRYRAGLTS